MTSKKLLQLSVSFGLTGLVLLTILMALPETPVSALTAGDLVRPADATWGDALRPQGQDPFEMRPITSLTLTYRPPAVSSVPTRFTASAEGSSSILYRWSFGDGQTSPLSNSPVSSNTYAAAGIYTVVVTAVNGFDLQDYITQTLLLAVGEPERLYMPAIFKEFTPPQVLADLACNNLIIEPANPTADQPIRITVEVENEGQAEADGFWIDLYLDPHSSTLPEPGREKRLRWQDACDGIDTCSRGIAWRISNSPLDPGQSRTFISIPNIYNPPLGQGFDVGNSGWPNGLLIAKEYQLYVYVDSINNLVFPTFDGAVNEDDETNNRCEKTFTVLAAPSSAQRDQSGTLPPR